MNKMKRYATPALAVSFIITSIGGTLAAVSCNPDMPEKLFPAYYFNIHFPAEEEKISTLTMERGNSATLPVTVTSNSDVVIYIRLTQDDQRALLESITFETRQEYVALEPGENATLYVTFRVPDFVTPGRYSTGIHGELKEPVEDRAVMTQGFNLVVTDKQP